MGIIALVLAIICFVVWWFVNPFLGIPFGIASVILARKEKHHRSTKNIAMLLGVIGLTI